ncbi:hypothetical protein QB910_000139 [Dabrowskivirus KKP3916]|uniref:Uncharacterized protein n=1 Tax=Alicyclobacillus phage KKP_3916 TaxID=3040651 RepID=A0AAT9V7W5_9CAUD|nr:hypothetical protein QB910_000139 [Alicyclobacillus phage KKP 3916]
MSLAFIDVEATTYRGCVTKEQIANMLWVRWGNRYKVGSVLSKLDGSARLWVDESVNWIFIYQNGIRVYAIDKSRL